MRNSFKTLQYFQYDLDTVMSFYKKAKAEKSFAQNCHCTVLVKFLSKSHIYGLFKYLKTLSQKTEISFYTFTIQFFRIHDQKYFIDLHLMQASK